MPDSGPEISGWMAVAVAIYLGIGAAAVGWVLVWPIVAATAYFIVANKIGIGVAAIVGIIKSKLKKDHPRT